MAAQPVETAGPLPELRRRIQRGVRPRLSTLSPKKGLLILPLAKGSQVPGSSAERREDTRHTNRRDTPWPGESLELHQKKAGTKRCSLFCCPSPCGAASPFSSLRSAPARRGSRPEKTCPRQIFLNGLVWKCTKRKRPPKREVLSCLFFTTVFHDTMG